MTSEMLPIAKRTVAIVVTVVLSVIFVDNAVAATTLEDAVRKLAKTLAQQAEDSDIAQLRIDEIKGPRIGTGREIANLIAEELRTGGLTVTTDPLQPIPEIRGRFSRDLSGAVPSIKLTVGIFDENGAELNEVRERFDEGDRGKSGGAIEPGGDGEGSDENTLDENGEESSDSNGNAPGVLTNPESLTQIVDDSDSVEQVLQPTFDALNRLERFATENKEQLDETTLRQRVVALRNQIADEALKSPRVTMRSSSTMAASKDGAFDIELLRGRYSSDLFEPMNIVDRRGIAVAPLEQDDLYQIRVSNRTNYDIGVAVTIDGINTLAYSEIKQYRKTEKWIIPAQHAGAVQGYHVDHSSVDVFKVSRTREGDVEEQLPVASDVGTISVEVFLAWKKGEAPLIGKILQDQTPGSTTLRTVQGPRISSPTKMEERIFCEVSVARLTVSYAYPSDLPTGDVLISKANVAPERVATN